MKKRVVLITGTSLRHEFFRKYIASDEHIEVLATYCESKKGTLEELVNSDTTVNDFRSRHLSTRAATEYDFFGLYCASVEDYSNPVFIEKGKINDPDKVEHIIKLNPDLIISYGCSIIRSDLLQVFKGRFLNIHLGLSPYYRGSGTNFWPFVNRELQFVGVTFMYIDEGIDTGEIIHQMRAEFNFNDNIHQVGNRLIRDAFTECTKLIKVFSKLGGVGQSILLKEKGKYYGKKHFKETSLVVAYKNISEGIIDDYIKNKKEIDSEFPIVINPLI